LWSGPTWTRGWGRQTSGWQAEQADDIIQTARARADQFRALITRLANDCTVVLSLLTLPLPPFALTPGWLASPAEAELRLLCATRSLGGM
jgi:hypothetical protein